jgi:formate dehydrogenase subunit beta
MGQVETKLREAIASLFERGEIDLVIGHEAGSLPLRSRPVFVRDVAGVERLAWGPTCANNLAVYLPRLFARPSNPREEYAPPTVGIVAKGCDARSVLNLVKEHQLPRDKVVIIGVPCEGIIDNNKVRTALDGARITAARQGNGALTVETNSGEQTLKLAEMLADGCLECAYPSLDEADVKVEGAARTPTDERYQRVAQFEAMSGEERWEHFTNEVSRCIRCYACRQVCPNCYCVTCFADQTKPRWIGAADELSDLMAFHIGRILHQAGRCVECDACVRACPMDIDLRVFTQKMPKDVEALYGYTAGVSADELPALLTFTENDDEGFISEP